MKLTSPCMQRCIGSFAALYGMMAFAQSEPGLEDDALVLSPFVVVASADNGYYASQTMAGGRLNQSIRDTGSAIQVVTAEFMEDIGATSIEQLLQYTTSSEVGGIGGNFTGSVNQGQGDSSTEEARRNPDGTSRIRGIAAPDRTRDFFKTQIPFDTYNTGRVDINRGANSFLFGLGTPAGVINSSPARAEFKNSGEVSFRLGSGGDGLSNRASLRVNRVLIDDKLAVLAAGLRDRAEYRQRPTYENDDRYYVAAKYRPFGNAKTVIDVRFESGKIKGNAPDVLLPLQNLDTFLDGGAGIDYGDGNGPISAADAALIARTSVDVYQNIRQYNNVLPPALRGVPYSSSLGGPPSWFNGALGLVYDGTNGLEPAFGYTAVIRNSDVPRDNSFWDPERNGATAPVNQYHGNKGKVGPPGWLGQGFTNLDTFDFSKYNLGWDNDYYTRDFSNFNVSLQQTFLNGKAGFEVAYDYQDMYRTSFTALNGAEARVMFDINETLFLPSDTFVNGGPASAVPNPNYGRPFIITNSQRHVEDLQNEAFRFTGFVKFDFADTGMSKTLAEVLGNHTLTLLADQSRADEKAIRLDLSPYGTGSSYDPGSGIGPGNARYVGNAARLVPQIVYIGPTQLSAFSDSSFSLSDFQLSPATYQLERPDGYEIDRWVWDASDARWERTTIEHHQAPSKNHRLQRTDTTSFALNTQSKFFDDHLVLNMGYREDRIDNWLNTKARYIGEGTANPDIDQTPDLSPTGWNFDDAERSRYKQFESSVFGIGGVVYLPKKFNPLPELVDDISFHYNESENFVPATDRVDANGDPIPPPTGSSKDWGVSVYMLNNRFIARLNWYKGNLENDVSPVTRTFPKTYFSLFTHYSNFNSQLISYLKSNYSYDPVTGATPGFANYDAMVAFAAANHPYMQRHLDALANIEPLLTSELLANWQFSLNTDGTVNYEVAGDVTDTVTVTAKGFEVELIYNPTRNWRIAFNAANQETVLTDVAPRLTALIGDFWENHLQQFGDLRFNGRLDQQNGQTVADQLLNKLVEYYVAKGQEGQPNGEQRAWRVNLITNYGFSTGPLKGFGIGGAYRWQDDYDAGYGLTMLSNGFVVPDVTNTFKGKPESSFDMFASYSRKVFQDRVNWKVQLNVQNIQNWNSDEVSIVAFQPDGSPARARFSPPLQVMLTNSFRF